jgi:hypothetical protein
VARAPSPAAFDLAVDLDPGVDLAVDLDLDPDPYDLLP